MFLSVHHICSLLTKCFKNPCDRFNNITHPGWWHDKKFQQLCVSRPCEYVNFICSGSEKEVVFDQKHSLFEFGKYLQRSSSPSTLYALPPIIPPTSDSSPDQTPDVTTGTNVMKIAHISNAPEISDIARISSTDNSVTSSHPQVSGASSLTATPDPPESPTSPSVNQYTRKGRLRKKANPFRILSNHLQSYDNIVPL